MSLHGVFQSTLPREERRAMFVGNNEFGIFQSTLPREERQIQFKMLDVENYFNPRSHERSDALLILCRQLWHISIHAPTRGATHILCYQVYQLIFQSTLPREERQFGVIIKLLDIVFQSTLPREERPPASEYRKYYDKFQSTLPREERLCAAHPLSAALAYFNPRSHERSDDGL